MSNKSHLPRVAAILTFAAEAAAPAISLLLFFPIISPSRQAGALIVYNIQRLEIIYFDPLLLGFCTVATWSLVLILNRSWDSELLGTGQKEFAMILGSAVVVATIFLLFVFLFKVEVSRPLSTLLLIFGVGFQLCARWLSRKILFYRRVKGNFLSPTLIIGSPISALDFAKRMQSDPMVGFTPTAMWSPLGRASKPESSKVLASGIVMFPEGDITLEALEINEIRAIIVLGTLSFSDSKIHELSWMIHEKPIKLFVEPRLISVPSSRLAPVEMFEQVLLGVTDLNLEGPAVIAKRLFDLVFGALVLVITIPFQLLIAITIALVDKCNPIFVQERVGRNGKTFRLLKFRTMKTASDDPDIRKHFGSWDAGNKIQFKLQIDPRVTNLGRVLRRYSLDELPQLFNVLQGNMSVVGPRPHVPNEVTQYASTEHRRLVVKPGITGLWQVGGRSDLTWEESIAFDLDYVETWSFMGDIAIILHTVRAVIAGSGAY